MPAAPTYGQVILEAAASGLALGDAAVHAARQRSWERSMGQLAAGYRRALEGAAARRQAQVRAA